MKLEKKKNSPVYESDRPKEVIKSDLIPQMKVPMLIGIIFLLALVSVGYCAFRWDQMAKSIDKISESQK